MLLASDGRKFRPYWLSLGGADFDLGGAAIGRLSGCGLNCFSLNPNAVDNFRLAIATADWVLVGASLSDNFSAPSGMS